MSLIFWGLLYCYSDYYLGTDRRLSRLQVKKYCGLLDRGEGIPILRMAFIMQHEYGTYDIIKIMRYFCE